MRICQACGAEMESSAGDCPECGRVPVPPEHPLHGAPDAPTYDFDDVPTGERLEATDMLVGAGIAFRWDAGYALRVDPDREEDVDVLFGHAGEEHDARASNEAGDEDEGERPDGDEAVMALHTLRAAAGRLAADPHDDAAGADIADATGVITMSDPPEGVNHVLWTSAAWLARQLLGLMEAADPEDPDSAEDTRVGARALRDVLRGSA